MSRPVSLFVSLCLLAVLMGCTRDPKEASKKYVTVGNRYYDQGKYKEAVLMYKRALQKHLKNGEAYYRLGLVELKMRQPAEAVHAFQRAVGLQPDNADARVKLADIYLGAFAASRDRPKQYLAEADASIKQLEKMDAFQFRRLSGYRKVLTDDVDGALEDFRVAHSLRPNDPGVGLVMFQMLVKVGKVDEGVQLAQQLIEAHKDLNAIYASLYMEFLRQKDATRAEQVLKQRVANNPKDTDAYLALAGHYHGSSKKPEMLATLNQLLSDRKTFPLASLKVGDFYFRIRDFDQAIRLYDEGVRLDPERKTDYQKKMIEALMFQGKRVEAAQLADTLLKNNPSDVDARAMRAAFILQGGKREELQGAINELQSIVTRMPKNGVIRYNLGRALLAKGELEQARQQFTEAIKINPGYLPPRITLAQLYLFKGEYAAALRTADEVIEIDSSNITAKLVRTSALMGSGETKGARVELEKLVETGNSRDAVFQLAMLNLREKKMKEAEAGFARLSKLTPPDLRGPLGLAQVEIAKGSMDNALKILSDQLAKDPNRAELRLAYANSAEKAGRHDIAVTEFKRLIEAQPKNAQFYILLGQALRHKHLYDEAGKNFQQALALNPSEPTPLLELALMAEDGGRPDDAKPYYEKILKTYPDNAPALNNLAYQMAEKGTDLDQALAYAQRARSKVASNSPLSDEVSDTLGWIYIKKNLHDSAISIFRGLVERHPANATWRYHLAMALYQKGDRLQARKECETALKTAQPVEKAKIQTLISRIG